MRLKTTYIALIKSYLLLLAGILIACLATAQPVANFTSDKVAGCSPLTVSFQDNSAGNPTEWRWDFGNGGTSGNATAQTIFITPGQYTIKLTVTNSAGTDSLIKTKYITVYEKPVAKFTVTDTSGCLPFSTKFIDQSTTGFGSITKWEWNFDDNTTSGEQNPTHTFSSSGNYNIALRVYNSGGCYADTSKAQAVKILDSLDAKFSFSKPVKCKPPETIQFNNLTSTSGANVTYLWDFGDGVKDVNRHPKHTYTAADSFTVTLTATNNLGCSNTFTLTKGLVINNVQTKIQGPDSICINTPATFLNSSTPTPLGYDWKFSDGDLISDTAAVKAWQYKGTYNVKLINYLASCVDSASKKITVIDLPLVNFTVSDTGSCTPPLTVRFSDKTTKAIQWQWDFGDGSSPGFTSDPVHTYTSYPTDSTFSVTLTVKNAMGCTNTKQMPGLIKIKKPIVNIDTREGGGCVPYVFKPLPLVSSTDAITSYEWDFGDGSPRAFTKNPTHTYNVLGNYDIKLIITTADGCKDSVTVSNGVKIGTKPTVDFTIGTSLECGGTEVNFTDLSAPADKWLWSFGDGITSAAKNPMHAFNDTGNFSIKLVAWNNGCADSVTKNNIIKIKPAVAKFGIVYSCLNRKQVQFIDSSILAQSWAWDFGDGSTATGKPQAHTYATAGTYNVMLTVTHGTCTDTVIKQVNIADYNPTINTIADSVCRGGSIVFTVANIDTTSIAKYSWDFGDGIIDSGDISIITHNFTSAGSYPVTLTIRDTLGCFSSFSKNNNVQIITPKIGFTMNTNAVCLNTTGTSVVFTDTSYSRAGIKNWAWSFGDGANAEYDNALPPVLSHTYTSPGTYFPKLKIIDGHGCVTRFTSANGINVTKPVAGFTVNHVKACNNDPVVTYNNSEGTALSYLWDFGDGSISNDSTPVKKYTVNGTYPIKLTVTDKYGCTDSMLRNNYVDVREVIASFSASDTFGTCLPFTVKFKNTSLNSYDHLWDLGDGTFFKTDSTNHPYTASGIYNVKLTATRSPFCSAVTTKTIEVNAPTASFTYSPTDGCAPLNVNFQVTTNHKLSYEWDFRDGTTLQTDSNNTTHSYNFPGQHIPLLLIKDSSGCIIPILGNTPINLYNTRVGFTADKQLVCDSGTIQFTDTSFSGSPVKNYLWKFGDGSTATIKNPIHFYNTPGLYTVSLFINTVYGCSDSLVQTAYIKVAASPSVKIISDTSYCGPSPVSFIAQLLKPDIISNWQWSFGNGNTSSMQNPPAEQYNLAGTYPVQLIVLNSSGCADTAYKNIYVHPVPLVNAGNDTAICINTTALLHASGADNYTWNPATDLSCVNCPTPLSSTKDNITYTVRGITVFGCEATDEINIEVKKPFRISGLLPFDSLCSGQSKTLNVTGAENYTWSPADGLNIINSGTVIASPDSTTIYKVIGYDSKNCFKDSATINLKVNATPSVNAGNDLPLLVGNSVQLTIQNSADVISWLWAPGTGLSCSNCINPIATPNATTDYTITVTNSSNCSATDNLTIFVTCDNNSIFLPTAFTPNRDGLNDYFYPASRAVDKILSFKIFNRFGEIVFLRNNFKANEQNAGWDGFYKGKPADIGSYIYYIQVACKNGEVINLGGKILLLR